jgi:hypothetical protein
MKIASITMVGHFPDGIDLHVRNLKWFLGATDYHVYIVTTPKRLDQITVKDDKVTFIVKPTPEGEFAESPRNPGFVNFWKWFPAIVRHYKIDPGWFLFMEQDLWFFDKFDCVPEPKTIKTFFSEKGPYHNIMLNDQVLQPHIWEGTHLINAEIVKRAIDFKIDFGYRAKSLLDRDREHYEKLFGGKLSISMWTEPETLTDFALYCALEERVGWDEVEKAVHLQGPEILHRRYPQLYNGYNQELLDHAQREVPYIDICAALAAYYIAGNWKRCEQINWSSAGIKVKRDLSKVARSADQWMTKEQYGRLLEVLAHLEKARRG